MPAGNACLFLEMKILISNMLESTRRGKNIQEKDLGEWNGAFLDFKGAVLLHPVRGGQLCFSPGHAMSSFWPVNGSASNKAFAICAF